jgi:hypothetical protein
MAGLDDVLKLITRAGDDLGRTVIRKREEQMRLPPPRRVKPTGERLMPETREAYERTLDIVPQVPFRHLQPDLRGGATLPAGGRMGPLIEAQQDIAQELAQRVRPALGSADQYFYHTGPIYEAAENAGVPSTPFMGRFSSYFAGTSPRTSTEPNFLNSTMLQYREAEGLPLNRPVLGLAGDDAANDVGYPLIVGQHPGLAAKLYQDPLGHFAGNPKPSSFGLNTAGNLQGGTMDTHAIRGALLAFDARYPGQIPRQWFKSDEAFGRYREGGVDRINLESDIDDSLKTATFKKAKSQVEYGPMADIYENMAGLLDIAPAEGQALGWFGLGQDTGLRSASRSIVGLMNDRINVTAQLLGLPQDVVAKLYFQGRIPLAGVGGAGLLMTAPEEAEATPQ